MVARGGAALPGQPSIGGKVISVHYQGSQTRVTVSVDSDLRISANAPAAQGAFREGEPVTLSWLPEALHAMEQDL